MLYYILRRILYAIPVLIGVNLITFALFFMVNSPEDMARMRLGQKHVKQEAVANWLEHHGYDRPLFFNANATGIVPTWSPVGCNHRWRVDRSAGPRSRGRKTRRSVGKATGCHRGGRQVGEGRRRQVDRGRGAGEARQPRSH